jgi:diacylglycerol kinase (ATP)
VTCHSAIICNASRYGGNFILEPGSTPFAAGLTAVCVTDNRRRTYISVVTDLLRGTGQRNGNLVRLSASNIEIRGTKAIQIDGDFIGYGPALISTEADFAQIIV